MVCVVIAAGFAAPSSGAAFTSRGLWLLAGGDARPWPALQVSDGRFYDYVSGAADGAGRYGESMLGYGLLQSGIRLGRDGYVSAGLRAISYPVLRPWLERQDPSVFESFALAAAYNLARSRLSTDRRFRMLRGPWEARLRDERAICLDPKARCPQNKQVVEAAAVLELVRSGLSSRRPGTWLSQRRAALGKARWLVHHTVPDSSAAVGLGREDSLVLSDQPVEPLAYHALALGFYARCLKLLGRQASGRSWRTLEAAARASWLLAAPDGELSYVGRSQEQSWTFPLTVYGLEVAAERSSQRWRRRFAALAQVAISRLRQAYPLTAQGLLIVPALAQGLVRWYPGMDSYAAARPYNGLTIVALNLAAAQGALRPPRPTPAAAMDASLLRASSGDMAIVRTDRLWYAIKRQQSSFDLRDDFGLVALELRAGSRWRQAMPLRPRASGESAGPVLISAGQTYSPSAQRIVLGGDGDVQLVGGGFGAIRKTDFHLQATSCGVVLRFAAAPGDLYRYSAFYPAASHPKQASLTSVTGGWETVTVNSPITLHLQTGYSSATEQHLDRAEVTFTAPPSQQVAITVCG